MMPKFLRTAGNLTVVLPGRGNSLPDGGGFRGGFGMDSVKEAFFSQCSGAPHDFGYQHLPLLSSLGWDSVFGWKIWVCRLVPSHPSNGRMISTWLVGKRQEFL